MEVPKNWISTAVSRTVRRMPLSPALAYAAEDDRAPPPFLMYGPGGKAAVQTSCRGGMGEFLAWIPELGGGVRGKKREGGWNPSFLRRRVCREFTYLSKYLAALIYINILTGQLGGYGDFVHDDSALIFGHPVRL